MKINGLDIDAPRIVMTERISKAHYDFLQSFKKNNFMTEYFPYGKEIVVFQYSSELTESLFGIKSNIMCARIIILNTGLIYSFINSPLSKKYNLIDKFAWANLEKDFRLIAPITTHNNKLIEYFPAMSTGILAFPIKLKQELITTILDKKKEVENSNEDFILADDNAISKDFPYINICKLIWAIQNFKHSGQPLREIVNYLNHLNASQASYETIRIFKEKAELFV